MHGIKVEVIHCPACNGEVGSKEGKYFCKECKRPFDNEDIHKELQRAHEEYLKEKEAQA